MGQHQEAVGMRLVGHNDIGGRGDCMHVNVVGGHAYVGHMGAHGIGTSILDVRDPARPRVVAQLDVPPHTHSHKVQVVDDILLVNYEQYGTAGRGVTGLKVFSIANPTAPRELAFMPMPGRGVHRMTYWEPPYAWVTGSDEGFHEQFLVVVDLSDPAHPVEVGRWWYPGMWHAGGERRAEPPGRLYRLHHALVRGDRAYLGFRDAGLIILDASDPARPRMVSELGFGADSHCTHTALPVPGRPLLAVTDEAVTDGCVDPHRRVRLVDITDERRPQILSMLPIPEGDFCGRGGRFGPHNLHEPRPGTLQSGSRLYLTYFNAGVRVYDIVDARNPREIAFHVPEAPPGRPAIQMNDLTVTADGLIWATDRHKGGLYVFEMTV